MNEYLDTKIIKRAGKRPSEPFELDKLKKSLIATCLSVKTPRGQAETIADLVTASVIDWLSTRPEVTSSDLRRVAAKHLQNHHPDAAYMYETYHHTI